jgi:hypothetical protein
MYYLNANYGSMTVFFNAQNEWGREVVRTNAVTGYFFQGYFKDLVKSVSRLDDSLFRRSNEIIFFVIGLVFLWLSRKVLRKELWLFSLLQIFIPVVSGTLLSFNRLVLLAFPVLFYGFNLISGKRIFYYATITVFIILQLTGIYLFFNNIFIV